MLAGDKIDTYTWLYTKTYNVNTGISFSWYIYFKIYMQEQLQLQVKNILICN